MNFSPDQMHLSIGASSTYLLSILYAPEKIALLVGERDHRLCKSCRVTDGDKVLRVKRRVLGTWGVAAVFYMAVREGLTDEMTC